MEKIWVVHSIELHQLYINQVLSQLSGFLFRKKKKKNRIFYVILLHILMQKNLSGHFPSKILFSPERYVFKSWNFHHSSTVWSAENDKKMID